MTTTTEARLQRIEGRLAALERMAGIRAPAPPPPVPSRKPTATTTPPVVVPEATAARVQTSPPQETRPHRAPVPASTSTPTPAPTPTRAPKPERDWERFFGMAVLGRVGVAAVLLAASYFAKLAYDAMSDGLKVASIYLLSGAFIGVGAWLRGRAAERYIALLWGGGAAAAYLAGLAAHLRYGLVGTGGGLALLLGASVLGQVLAHRLRHATLATVALAGAFAAPLFVAFPIGERSFPLDPTFLLVYLLALHGWSAYVEQRWQWTAARIVGVVGTVTVAGVWLTQAGTVDASTYLHVHLYLLGLVLPELVRAWQRKSIDSERWVLATVCIGVTEGGLLMAAGGPLQLAAPVRLFATLAGAGWLAAACALAVRPVHDKVWDWVRSLAATGGMLIVLGILHMSQAVIGNGTNGEIVGTTLALLVATGAAFGLQRLVRTAEPTAITAAVFAAVVALQYAPVGVTLGASALALVAAAILVVLAQTLITRGIGYWLGLGVTFLACLQADRWDHAWQAGAVVGMALWTAGVMAWDRWRTAGPMQIHGTAGLWLTGVLWAALAFASGLATADLALVNPATGAAVVLVAAALFSAIRLHVGEARRMRYVPLALYVLALAVAFLAGQRETAEATRGLDPAIRAALFVLYLAASGVGIAAIGWWRKAPNVVVTGALFALAGTARALITMDEPALAAWGTLELLAPLAALLVIARWRPAASDLFDVILTAGWLGAAFGWVAYTAQDRLPDATTLLNMQVATGLAILAGFSGLPASLRRGTTNRAFGNALVLGAVVLGYLIGLFELLTYLSRHAEQWTGAWPAALVSVYSTICCAALLLLGFRMRDRRLRYTALVGFGLVIAKIGLFDLQAASLPLRILVTGLLGLVLLAAAFAYARRKASELPADEPDPQPVP